MVALPWSWWQALESAPWDGVALLACVPALAITIDRLLGEPPVRWHPVVWMGRWLGWAGSRLAPDADQSPAQASQRIFWCAALAWCAGAGAVFSVSWLIQ